MPSQRSPFYIPNLNLEESRELSNSRGWSLLKNNTCILCHNHKKELYSVFGLRRNIVIPNETEEMKIIWMHILPSDNKALHIVLFQPNLLKSFTLLNCTFIFIYTTWNLIVYFLRRLLTLEQNVCNYVLFRPQLSFLWSNYGIYLYAYVVILLNGLICKYKKLIIDRNNKRCMIPFISVIVFQLHYAKIESNYAS